MEEFVYLNGVLVPKKEAKISLFDKGLLYGDGLFETMRAYQGKIFRLEDHLKRLFKASKIVNLEISLSLRQLAEAINLTIEANNLKEAYVRLTVSRGIGKKETIFIIARKLFPHPESYYKKGIRAIVVKTRKNKLSPLSNIKSLNFLNSIIAKMEAEKKGVEEGIFLNTDGFLAEGTVSNIFLVFQKSLFTPSLKTGILPGITRKVVLELVPGLGLKTYEKEILPEEIWKAKEIFLTNSLREIVPLIKVDSHLIGKGKPGLTTRKIHQAYQHLVQKELNV